MMLTDDDHDEQRGLDNARRIVACVNACAGICTEALEDFAKTDRFDGPTYDDLTQQRDELLAALESLVLASNESDDSCYGTLATWFVRNIAEPAIASVKCYGQPEKSAKTEVPAIVFYPAGSLGEEIEEEGRPA